MTPLVLVPGMMCDERLFGPQAEAFGRERPVIVARIDQDDTVEAMASSVLAQAPGRFALAGLSLGGIVAMGVMALAPERVERLALLDTNPLAEKPDVAARREPQIEAVRQGRLAEVMASQMIPNYGAGEGPDEAVTALCLAMAVRLGPDVFVRQSRALQARPDRCETLARVTAPTLVLSGAHDRLCPRDRHELMHRLVPSSRLAFVEEAGHLPTLQRPAETTALLRSWLAGG
jgi:pimeloyl-ACP methyl ester carboxylesterase